MDTEKDRIKIKPSSTYIEDEIDLKRYDEAIKSYEKEPKTFSFEDVMKELELD